MARFDGVFIALAGLFGALGVAAAAASAHLGGDLLATASSMLLAHAPALLGVSVAAAMTTGAPRITLRLGGLALTLGAALFAGDLAAREFHGDRLFAMAAPTGGSLMILGWLAVCLGGLAHLALGPRRDA